MLPRARVGALRERCAVGSAAADAVQATSQLRRPWRYRGEFGRRAGYPEFDAYLGTRAMNNNRRKVRFLLTKFSCDVVRRRGVVAKRCVRMRRERCMARTHALVNGFRFDDKRGADAKT